MPKTKISEYSATANSNTDVASINIDEGCAPSGINNAIRAVMGHLKDFQAGTNGDSFNGPVGTGTAAAVAATTLTTSSTVTHNGGTANGVAYLNGSKVLTTGSALVFDGTNLGVGVTPSAWGTYKAVQVGNTSLSTSSASGTTAYITGNGYYNGTNWIYQANDYASRYACLYGNGTHAWFTAPSGTAGNTISFTQAMTLDASGNLGVGTTSLNISGFTKSLTISSAGQTGVEIVGTRAVNGAIGDIVWKNSASSNINLGVIQVRRIGADNTGEMIFRTTNAGTDTERMRIDSSGNLLVGTTSTVNASKQVILFPGNTQNGSSIQTSQNTSGAVFQYFLDNAGATCGSITRVGTTSAVLYNTSSDRRLKENISDADSASSLIESLQVRKFDWKADGSHQRYGFVAQELVTVAPEAVHQPKDTDEMMAVDYSKLVPMLVKEIQSLRQRVASLEA